MKFTLSWLKEHLETKASVAEICQKLNNIGLEVEKIENKAQNLEIFTVAQIIEAKPHPNSNKLQICQVNVGDDKNLQIICGAANARNQLKVAYAPIDSVIPNGKMKIKKAKIAGVESCGMLCSFEELGLDKTENGADGIIEIDEKFAIGTKITEVFGLNESVIEINITPNRGDCLGVFGIARDLAAAGMGTLKFPQIKELKGSFSSPIKVNLIDQNCSYFSGIYIQNIAQPKSPKWLKERLEAIGCNSINAIVDIANYVMFSIGQPLHIYNANQLSGDLIFRKAIKDENFHSLKGQNYQLTGGELVVENKVENEIENKAEIVALAGIMGGFKTAVNFDCKNIFLESAFFNPQNIAQTCRKLNISSDSAYRFERNVDLTNVKNALIMATNLILEICGGEPSFVVEAGNNIAQKTEINLDLRQIKKIIGIEIEENFVIETLENLGFFLKKIDENLLKVLVPSHRSDVAIYQDLIEEVVRIYGLNNINSQSLPMPEESHNINKISPLEIISKKLVNLGFVETINYSFIDENFACLFDNLKPELKIQNPIAKQMSQMRPNLLPAMLQNVLKNQNRGFENLSLFEAGRVFLGTKPEEQKNVVVALRTGENKEQSHYQDQRSFDVFDLKRDLFLCLEILGFSAQSFALSSDVPNYYHPYRSKALKLGKKIVAYFGELHPIILSKFELQKPVNVFELFIEELPINLKEKLKERPKKPLIISDLPTVKRDFAFILEENIEIGELLKKVVNSHQNINEINLFDVYQDKKLGDNKKSIAFSVKIQPLEKTLTSEEIDLISAKIIEVVESNFPAILRTI